MSESAGAQYISFICFPLSELAESVRFHDLLRWCCCCRNDKASAEIMAETNEEKKNPVKVLASGGGTAIRKVVAPVRNAVVAPARGDQSSTKKKKEEEGKSETFSEHFTEALSKPVSAVTKSGEMIVEAVKTPFSKKRGGGGSEEQRGAKGPQPEEEKAKGKSETFSEHFTEILSKPVKAVTKGGEKIVEAVKRPFGKNSGGTAEEQPEEEAVPAVPPDAKLQNMNVIIKKRLKGVSIKDYYETIWSEGNHTDKEPFYGRWLEASGKNNVKVEDWTFAEEGGEKIIGGWDGEDYSQKRVSRGSSFFAPLRYSPAVT